MANNKTTYTLQIDAELGQLEKKLGDVRGLMAGVLGSAQAPKGLEKAFEKVEGLLDRIKEKASYPITSKAGFSSIEKDVSSANVALAGMLKVVSQISSMSESAQISFLPKDAQDQLNTIITSLAAYQSAIDAATTETAELAAARRDLAKAEGEVANAQARLENREGKLSGAKQSRVEAQAAIDAIKAREKALEGLYEEQKKIEEFYSKPDEQGQKRNRSKKYAEVSMRPQDIKRKITELEGASAGDVEALQRWNEQLKSAKNNIDSYGRQVDTARRTLEDSKESYTSLTDKVAELEKAFNTNSAEQQQKAFNELRTKAEELGISLEGIGESYSETDAKALVGRFADLRVKGLEPVAQAAGKAEKEAREMGRVLEIAEGKIDGATESFEEMTEAARQQETFETKIKQFLGLSGAAQVLRAALRDAMQTITELDKTMTEMSVVTDLGVGDYWEQLPQYTKRANELGLAINDVYKADTLFYQQGLKTNEVVAISTETMKMARIAGLDTAEATDRMTAALRGFNMELNETGAQKVADVYSELAAITAADVDEISTAMTKTASIASSAGMEFETTAAFLSQIIETTRESAETAGTAMKTVIARFQELKKAPDEIGEVDGEIVDANAIETALRSVGVALRDSSGQFRELDDVFLELSSKWDGLDKNTQRYIATIAAGSRQQSRFIAMMSDYGRTQELVASANNSAGASNEQFAKTAESLEFKINQLKNAWHEFTMGIMESELVKFGVDVLTKFLEIVNKATDGIDGFGGSITKLMTIFGIFKLGSKLFTKFKAPLISFFSEIVSESRKTGEKAAQAFDEGVRGVPISQEQKVDEGQNVSSFTNITEGWSQMFGKRREAREKLSTDPRFAGKKREDFISKQQELKDRGAQYHESNGRYYKKGKKGSLSKTEYTKEIGAIDKELDITNKELEEFDNLTNTVLNGGKEGFQKFTKGVEQAGQAISGIGIGISVFGGILSSLGLEEQGELISDIGQLITMVGGALSIIPPILTLISSHPIVAIIVGVLTLVLALIVGIISAIQNSSPEAKLKRATENAEAAADAAEHAAEAYNDLAASFDDLEDKYAVLDDLRKGTEEWNKAVQDINSSVLELISQYPELAGLVENEGGVLTLDVNSDEAQQVLRDAKTAQVVAQGAALGSKISVEQAKREVELNQIDEKTFDAFKTESGALAGFLAGLGTVGVGAGIGTGIGAGVGAGVGAGIGAAAGAILTAGLGVPVTVTGGAAMGAGAGAGIGAIIGAIASIPAAIATGIETAEIAEIRSETNRENFKEIAQAFASGDTGTTKEEIVSWIETQGIAVGDAAERMAEEVLNSSDEIVKYGESLNAMDAANKAYYQAMATNAQQMIDLGKYTDSQINQMTEVVDEDLTEQFKNQYVEDFKKEQAQTSDKDELEDNKLAFAQEVYGENARVEGNKILNEKGEVVREFTDEEAWINEMAAAEATKKAAEAMEEIPGAILNSVKNLEPELQKVFNKAFEGKDLIKGELEDFKKTLGTATYYDSEGNIATSYEDLTPEEQAAWGTKENYLKSLDADYSNIGNMWENLTDAQKKAYGWNGDVNDQDSLDKAKEAYENTYIEILDAQSEAFSDADKNIKKMLGDAASYSDKLSSEAALAWTNNLQDIATSGGDINALNDSLTSMLSGLSQEEANLVMAQVNAIDKMDINAWKNLSSIFDSLGIATSMSEEALENFIKTGIEVSGAIEKINFDTLADDTNNTYKLLDKIKQGGRTYSKADYTSLVASNKELAKSFTQIGDDFIYVGGSMEELTSAVKENTVAKLEEANRQLQSRADMSKIINEKSANFGLVSAMDQSQLLNYLVTMRQAIGAAGGDLSEFGIEGLSMETDFSKATNEQLKTWAEQLATEGSDAKLQYYQEDAATGLRKANIQRYTHNSASFNAKMASQSGEFQDEHQEALILQAIQSGGVSNELIKQYQEAIESGQEEEVKELGALIAEQTEAIIETDAGRDTYIELVNRVTDAIEQQKQAEIDKLSELNDSIDSANEALIGKIQEQINADRLEREKQEAEENISNLYSQQAYLAMDTSGANLLQSTNLEEQIKQAEQDYEDQLVDQALQTLQDANERAAEQRDRQINLMTEQLEYERESGQIAREAEQAVRDSIASIETGTSVLETKMGQILWGSEGEGEGLSELETEQWVSDLQGKSTAAANWLSGEADAANVTGEVKIDNTLTEEEKTERLNAQNSAVADAAKIIKGNSTGFRGVGGAQSSGYIQARQKYVDAGGTASDFDQLVKNNVSASIASGGQGGFTGHFPETDEGASYVANMEEKVDDQWWFGDAYVNGESIGKIAIPHHLHPHYKDWFNGGQVDAEINKLSGGSPQQGWLAMYNGEPYGYNGWGWARITEGHSSKNEELNSGYRNLKKKMTEYLTSYKTGGVADFTGPAWLDGTKSRPEYVLNAAQTERFFSLIDVLERYDSDSKNNNSSGDNYFEIEINVEKIEDDYDVEQIANKIRSMIYEDAMYRNVNAINHIR